MIHTARFGAELKKRGFTFYSGVPCSFLKDLINYAINECEYVMAANEGDAVAIAAGSCLGGRRSVVLMQNSGLTNATSPLASLLHPFRIPLLGFVSLRGEPGLADEPQHELMGRITGQMLTLMEIKWEYLSTDWEEAVSQLNRAVQCMDRNESFFFIVRKGTFDRVALREQESQPLANHLLQRKSRPDQFPTRYEALQTVNALKDSQTIQLATTGKTGRELYEIEDAPHNLYMIGSMGCVSSLGLGLALTRREKAVIAIDGDGALLMRLGSLATNGFYRPPNLLHVLLDNNVHDSTGGQQTVSHNVQFVEAAAACGYPRAIYVHDLQELASCIEDWKKQKQLTFLYLKIARGSRKELGRPKIKPYEVKERLQVFVDDQSGGHFSGGQGEQDDGADQGPSEGEFGGR
ncbi:phosphonopyruvate decarboxylase [Brevibacillus sp. SYP-B805]|uniref:phosphonopyruvate decarboxylase n=1 Tax=Brevibacillus sp. SYP-B805 TaxID=1578199 RepID=UPI0013EB3730|nr:phosphonopyruvate decarboxylase [Brevibacillus sp. SYP-B805]NGQ93621.1 phosphonopyruvate decarboxylase [Brevibacillus sp. SYP-B805]